MVSQWLACYDIRWHFVGILAKSQHLPISFPAHDNCANMLHKCRIAIIFARSIELIEPCNAAEVLRTIHVRGVAWRALHVGDEVIAELIELRIAIPPSEWICCDPNT